MTYMTMQARQIKQDLFNDAQAISSFAALSKKTLLIKYNPELKTFESVVGQASSSSAESSSSSSWLSYLVPQSLINNASEMSARYTKYSYGITTKDLADDLKNIQIRVSRLVLTQLFYISNEIVLDDYVGSLNYLKTAVEDILKDEEGIDLLIKDAQAKKESPATMVGVFVQTKDMLTKGLSYTNTHYSELESELYNIRASYQDLLCRLQILLNEEGVEEVNETVDASMVLQQGVSFEEKKRALFKEIESNFFERLRRLKDTDLFKYELFFMNLYDSYKEDEVAMYKDDYERLKHRNKSRLEDLKKNEKESLEISELYFSYFQLFKRSPDWQKKVIEDCFSYLRMKSLEQTIYSL